MAPSHVPGDHLPLQGQNIYTDSSYEHLFPAVEQYGTPAWNQSQLNHHQLVPNAAQPQPWHHGSFPQQSYNTINQQYGNAAHGYQTGSPYQYSQFNNHTPVSGYTHSPAVDPALGMDPNALRAQQQSPYQQLPMRNSTPQGQTNTVTPQSLQQNPVPLQNPRPSVSPFQIPKSTTEMFAQGASPATYAKPVSNPKYEIPKGRKSGGFYVYDQAALASATKSTALNKLVTFGSEPLHLASNRTALPLYTPRQSLKDLKRAGADNKKLLAKKSLSAKSRSRALGGNRTADSLSAVKREVTDSESYTESSDDDSEYTDDEEDEPSPLPASRPEEPHGAVQYDTIKATWYPRRASPSSEKVKESLRDFWDVLNTIQKRWRADSRAVTEAEERKKTGELPVLKSRVQEQRKLLESALRSALENSHPDVLYHMGQVKPFLYLCYQFLANRFKMQDYNGSLPSAIYEILSRCTGTLTTELLEETKVIKALNSMKKNADEKNKTMIQQIVEGASAGSKKSKVSSPPEGEAAEIKNAKRPAPQPAYRPTGEGPTAKKVKPTEVAAIIAKKAAPLTPVAKALSVTNTAHQKRIGEKAAVAPVKARGNQVVNKPSTFFSSLNAASKKPAPATSVSVKTNAQPKTAVSVGNNKKPAPAAPNKPSFSFAETMAQLLKPKEEVVEPAKPEKQLPPETPEEKARRLRKESRRHLRVTFRPDASLVSVRYFNHDPDEELGHEENFVRDAGDIGGEGRMFKQHRDMDVDEDDEDLELEYHPWIEPTMVDFSVVPLDERNRNYIPFGGGELKPITPEKDVNEQMEKAKLLVFYTHPSDIPPTPREPPDSEQVSTSDSQCTEFGTPPTWVHERLAKFAPPAAASAPDFSNLEAIFKNFATPASNPPHPTMEQPAYIPPPPTATPAVATPDLASILSALQGLPQAPAQAPIQAPVLTPVPQQQVPQLDLTAILSAIQGSAGGASLPQPPPGWPPFPLPPLPQQQNGGIAYQNQQPPSNNQPTGGGTKRQREDSSNSSSNNNINGSFKKHKGGFGGHNNNTNNNSNNNNSSSNNNSNNTTTTNSNSSSSSNNSNNNFGLGERPHKVKICRYFQKGKCAYGDDCTFIHDTD